ncbi:hypothetical protein [Streptacidiphilus neutrinimicus]|uniref:hypothetical protein n=1 Tax=Streptacidiphilus neutrinimicus TaxID=105420 RepID=UPI0005A6F9DC|nr:hypothetical protein [Streptacidiphilus neutrinimicus]
MEQSYEVERREGASYLIREYFATLTAALAYFDQQVEAARRHPQAQVEIREYRPGERGRTIRRWTSQADQVVGGN